MRSFRQGCWAALVWQSLGLFAAAGELPGLRDPENLVFEGVQAFDHREVRAALQSNFSAAFAAHPGAPLADYLQAIERTMSLGYQHSGFGRAAIKASYDVTQNKVVVRASEGPRHVCGDVEITGCLQPSADALRKCLTSPDDAQGVLWKPGHATPFDELTLAEIRRQLSDTLAATGFLSPQFDVQVVAPTGQPTAKLLVAIQSEGPRGEIGKIVVTGNKRDAADTLLRHVHMRTGQSYDSQLSQRISNKFAATGRYLSSNLQGTLRTQQDAPGRAIYDVWIDLYENDVAPPLDQPLSATEQAAVKLSNWAQAWSRGETEEDLVVSVECGPKAIADWANSYFGEKFEQTFIERAVLRAVISPRRGTVISMQLFAENQQPILDEVLAFYPERMIWGSPFRQTRFEQRHDGQLQTQLSLSTRSATLEERAEDPRPFHFSCQFGVARPDDPPGSPFQVEAKFSPASLLWLVHAAEESVVRDGRLEIRGAKFQATIDATTGRPIEWISTDPEQADLRCSVRTQRGTLLAEQQRLDRQLAGLPNQYDAARPWSSLGMYSLDAWIALGRPGSDNNRKWLALRKLLTRWHTPPAAGALETTDGEKPRANRFQLPQQLTTYDYDDLYKPDAAARQNLAGAAHRWYRMLTPRNGPLWPVGRDVLLGMGATSPLPAVSLSDLPEVGPVGELLLASVRGESNAARAGLTRLTLDDFRRDYRPLLAGDSYLSQWLLSLAEAARTLDERELRDLAAVVDAGPSREAVAATLLHLRAHPNRPVADTLADALDQLWLHGLREQVSAALRQLDPERQKLEAADLPRPKPAGLEAATPVEQQLRGLEEIEAELQTTAAARGSPPVPSPAKR